MIYVDDKLLWPEIVLPSLQGTDQGIEFFVIGWIVESGSSKEREISRSFGAFWSIWDVGAWKDLVHGRSSTGHAKEEGGSHLEDQLDHSTIRSSSSTRPAKLQLDRAEKSKSNPKNVASPLTFL
ncbi:unnamed protein product [Microthlaspi erraticum]|uniref:Uncharacterized protein n=1 Tax=Microthlaspi erraticum TaxID=1685480 RepID=A0A6D2J217_9BRAS|nr:unnamed protein product [Microthlaspi erraticum]